MQRKRHTYVATTITLALSTMYRCDRTFVPTIEIPMPNTKPKFLVRVLSEMEFVQMGTLEMHVVKHFTKNCVA